MDDPAAAFVTLGVLVLGGLIADAGSRRLGLPRVTILLVLGFAAGPGGLDVLPRSTADWFAVASTLALTLVGFLLGAEFTFDRVRADGRRQLVFAVIQGMVTALVVAGGLWVGGVSTTTALLLGGIAVATAPAATLAVVQEQRAEGPFARTLVAVVALDDIIALALFGVMATLASLLEGSGGAGTLALEAIWEVGGAVLLGLTLGIPAAALTGRLAPGLPTREEAYGVALLCAGLALWMDVSFLLASVTVGITIANRAAHHERTFREIEQIEWLALIVFFVLAGASLEVEGVVDVGLLGIGYLVLRTLGKLCGCALGGARAGMDSNQRRWLGAAMLPQAGVAIGLALLAADRFPAVGDDVLTVVIGATVIFEVVGPVLTKLALIRVGEAGVAATEPGEAPKLGPSAPEM